MKKLVLFIVVLHSIVSFAQDMPIGISEQYKKDNNYYIDMEIGFWGRRGGRRICEIWSKVYVNNENKYDFSENDYLKHLPFSFSSLPKEIRYEGYLRRRNLFGDCSGDSESFDYIIPVELCKREYRRTEGDNHGASLTSSIRIYIVPLHTLTTEKIKDTLYNSYLPIGEKVKLFAKEGFPSELYNYQIATKVDSTRVRIPFLGNRYIKTYNWQNLRADLKEKNGEILSISAEDIFDSEQEALNNIGKKVYFRVVSFDKDDGSVCSSSSVIELTVTASAPAIINKEIIKKPLCYDDTLTQVKLTFDRKLRGNLAQYRSDRGNYLGETLQLSIEKEGMSVGNIDLTETLLQSEETTISFQATETNLYKLNTIGTIYYLQDGVRDSIFTYTDGDKHRDSLLVTVPTPVTANLVSTQDNLCHAESAGSIEINVMGGTPPYKYQYGNINWVSVPTTTVSGTTFVIGNLPQGTYTVTIQDSNDCVLVGNPIVAHITHPEKPIQIINETDASFKKDISGYGLNNGEIRAEITGGTSDAGRYQVTLTKTNGNTITQASARSIAASDSFEVIYTNLEPGEYVLVITDKNNCTYSKSIAIKEPDPLVVTLSEKTSISCNPLNDDPNNDPTLNKDGVLLAQVTGGVPFEGGIYKYKWYRVEGTTEQEILAEQEAIITQLTAGTYRVAVEDKNQNKTQGTFTLKFPERLVLSTESSEISCSAPNSGVAKASVTGGVPPYSFQWSDGQTSQTASGLSAGKYFVSVTDSKGCMVQAQVVLSYPEAVKIDSENITDVTCFGQTNGSISVTLSGGKGQVAVRWYNSKNQEITNNISADRKTIRNLSAGKYKIVLRDEGDCPALEKDFEITQPEKISINLSQEITLCQGDSYTFDLSKDTQLTTFRWLDGLGNLLSTEPTLTISEQGAYSVEVSNAQGCTAQTTFQVKQSSQVLALDFLAATTSYYDYTLKLINLSKQADTLEWLLPDDVVIISDNKQEAEIRFSKEGTYTVGLRGTLGECTKVIYKTLFVEKDRIGIAQEATLQKNIDSFLIVPNPNSGVYELHIKLSKASQIRVRLIDMLGRELFAPEEFSAQKEFQLPFNKPHLSAGQYIIILEAGNDVLSQKMIVK